MERSGATGIRMAAMLVTALGAAIACTTVGQWSFLVRHNSIQQIQELPVDSVVHLVGVVIDADEAGGKYWIEDKTGALPIGLNPGWPGIHVGETISVEAKKLAGIEAVSYTHLDVYKRQPTRLASTRRLTGLTSFIIRSSPPSVITSREFGLKSRRSSKIARTSPATRESPATIRIRRTGDRLPSCFQAALPGLPIATALSIATGQTLNRSELQPRIGAIP